jgi:hypothetical protein
MLSKSRSIALLVVAIMLLLSVIPAAAQGGPGTKDFLIRDFGACINLPDFTEVTEPDDFNTVYNVPGLFSINFAQYLMPVASLPASSDEIYGAMISLLDTVSASDYSRIAFTHPQYISAAVEFTLDGKRMFGMIYRNQDDTLFFLFADKVEGFDMLAIGRAIFAANRYCTPIEGLVNPNSLPRSGVWDVAIEFDFGIGRAQATITVFPDRLEVAWTERTENWPMIRPGLYEVNANVHARVISPTEIIAQTIPSADYEHYSTYTWASE